ncbi:MAG: hypothetical protein ACOX05_00985 [Bacillota bacterium]|jgi:hypothetical protein
MKRFLVLVVICVLACTLMACSNGSGDTNPQEESTVTDIDKIKVDTSDMVKEEVTVLGHIYFDMYPQRAAFFGAEESEIATLANKMAQYIDEQSKDVKNETIIGYLNDFKNFYKAIEAYASDMENTDKEQAAQVSATKAAENLPQVRGICNNFEVPWVYFWQEQFTQDGVYFAFNKKDTEKITDENGSDSGLVALSIDVSGKCISSTGPYGEYLINFDLHDAMSDKIYKLEQQYIQPKTILETNIQIQQKARAILTYHVPKNLTHYILVQDTCPWSKKENRYIRMASYSMF